MTHAPLAIAINLIAMLILWVCGLDYMYGLFAGVTFYYGRELAHGEMDIRMAEGLTIKDGIPLYITLKALWPWNWTQKGRWDLIWPFLASLVMYGVVLLLWEVAK